MSPHPIPSWPAEDRPRERLLRHGAAALGDAELVALLLGSGASGETALDAARGLLIQWGGLSGLAAARPAELARAHGIGPAKAARLVAGFALTGRLQAPRTGVVLGDSAVIASVAQPEIGRERVERVLVLIADGGQRLLRVEPVATGRAQGCPVPVREVVAAVLRHDGVAFALAHNHPGGDPTPTDADRAATDRVIEAAAAVGLRFLDHVVVTDASWRSVSASR